MCPWQSDGECDELLSTLCTNGDCWDCDPLRLYHYDCAACIANNGYWCPGDALCRGAPLTEGYMVAQHQNQYQDLPLLQTSCPLAEDWQQTCIANTDNNNNNDNVFTDPLYDAMKWSYDLINIEPVWRQGITGAGVHVRVNDVDGVDATHPEFRQRFDIDNSCPTYLPTYLEQSHGTACASIIGAQHDNDHCAVGIAPGVTLSSCRVANPLINDQGAQALVQNLNVADISSNSFGPSPCQSLHNNNNNNRHRQLQCIFDYDHDISPCRICGHDNADNADNETTTTILMDLEDEFCRKSIIHHCTNYYEQDPVACAEYLDLFVDCQYHALSFAEQELFVRGITEGRNGKGVIFVFPAGNEREFGSNANLDGFVNSRFTIAVGAVDRMGKRTRYSTPGSPVLISAPAGDLEYISNNIVAKPGGGCHDVSVGTSFAAPVVAGVIALLLEVRPDDLSWRDVQGILVATAQYNDPTDDAWSTNGVGLNHSYYFGFGLVDAEAAVGLAQVWETWGPEQQIMVESGPVNISIPDDPTQSASSSVLIPDNYANLITESVVVYLDVFHGSRGDLAIALVSPSGSESLLVPSKRPENTQLQGEAHWKLTTVRHWGESPAGNWTLTLVDEKAGTLEDCADLEFDFYLEADDDDTLIHVECQTFENRSACVDGQVLASVANELTVDNGQGPISAAEACCACGGGVQVAGIPHLLQSWRMIVYGHNTTID